MQCICCKKEQATPKKQWWHLIKYHGLSGTFCNLCFEKVAHDCYGKPRHPVAYRIAIKKLSSNA